jgi:pilus assembly protein CpaB
VEMMREALYEPEDEPEAPPEPAFVAAPALPLESDLEPSFVVKPSEGRAARRGMEDLREQALRNVIANAAPGSSSGAKAAKSIRRGRSGMFTPARIILLVVALSTGGIAAYLATQLDEPAAPVKVAVPEVVAAPTVQVLVARDPIGVGQRVTASAVEWIEWPESAVRTEFVTSAATPEAITEMEGSVARAEILPGEPILEQKLRKTNGGFLSTILESGKRGVSVTVSAASASGGFIEPNDYVDVVSTRVSDTGQDTETILRNVRVLAINGRLGNRTPTNGEQLSEDPTTLFSSEALATLELDSAQAELVINATAQGQLSLVLRSIEDLTETGSAEERAANRSIRLSSPFWQK